MGLMLKKVASESMDLAHRRMQLLIAQLCRDTPSCHELHGFRTRASQTSRPWLVGDCTHMNRGVMSRTNPKHLELERATPLTYFACSTRIDLWPTWQN